MVIRVGVIMAVAVAALFIMPSVASAQTLQSTHYRFDESTIGAGGMVEAASTSYRGTSALSDIAIGNSSSANYQVDSGSKTSPDPALSFAVTNSSANFGSFSASSTVAATATFSVSNYTTYGYVVQVFGNPPTNGAYTIDAMSATNTSQIGVEQFGMNLVANTSPVSIGSNPDNGQFGFGSVTTDYATPNQYRYIEGDTIAHAVKNSGVTTYTITYIANVAGLTPGGRYTSGQTLVVTGTY